MVNFLFCFIECIFLSFFQGKLFVGETKIIYIQIVYLHLVVDNVLSFLSYSGFVLCWLKFPVLAFHE
jgi:hypothetical protein